MHGVHNILLRSAESEKGENCLDLLLLLFQKDCLNSGGGGDEINFINSPLSVHQDQHLKEVSLQPIEEDVSEEEQSESELSEVEEEEEENVEEESTPTNDKDDGAAGDEEVIGLMGQLKSARLKKIEEKLTEEQLKSEKE